MEYDTMRIGIVMAVNAIDHTCRVKFPDLDDMISDWISVLQRPNTEVIAEENAAHTHAGKTTYWMPSVNDTVICICQPIFNGDAFVLGVM